MGKLILDKQIDRIFIVDDNQSSRTSIEEALYDSVFDTIPQNEQVDNVDNFINKIIQENDAVISDHYLKIKSYFPINGARFVSLCHERHIPSLLVTRYDKTQIAEIRKYRQNIPVLINPADFDADTIPEKLETCIREFKGQLTSERVLRRTLVRVDSVDETHIYVIIPGWDSSEIIGIGKEELPLNEADQIAIAGKRIHVMANIGCENPHDLYFDKWEIK